MAELHEFENSLKLTKISFFLSGINLSIKRSIPLNFLFIFNFLWLFIDVFGEFYWVIEGVRAGKSFEELSVIVPCTVICFLATFRCVPLYLNNKLLANIFDKLREIHPTSEFKENEIEKEEKEITARAVKLFYNLIIFMVIANSSVVIAFCLLPLLLMAIDYQKTGEIELKLPFLVKYFFDPFTMTKWPFVYLHHIWSSE
ncbi:putative odorant receptor 92a [Pieris napi]|uniref:putative odorant receptor 92a n=1 Tax=Pieris napi TaxID=78633 RepID=UPI001FB8AEF5|nr:putative odorant receptor 92a [Pieris napi]